jgi:hypothetical protein
MQIQITPSLRGHTSRRLPIGSRIEEEVDMTRIFGLIGAPSSAGALSMSRKDACCASCGRIIPRLTAASISLVDYGDFALRALPR